MPPLDHPCPQCQAAAGQRCRNWRGHACAPHHGRGKPMKPTPRPAVAATLFDGVPDEPAVVPAEKVTCSWCGEPCPSGRTTCDYFCARMEERASKPAVVFPGNQDILWEDD